VRGNEVMLLRSCGGVEKQGWAGQYATPGLPDGGILHWEDSSNYWPTVWYIYRVRQKFTHTSP